MFNRKYPSPQSIQLSCIIVCLVALLSQKLPGQTPSPNSIITRSISFHDPQGAWEKSFFEIALSEIRPGSVTRSTIIQIDIYNETFKLDQDRDDHRIQYELNKDECQILIDGSIAFDDTTRSKYHLTEKRALLLKNYYTYLYGLPMKLRDPGTILGSEVGDTIFNDIPSWVIKMNYDENVGKDVWYFYFNKDDYSLIGYRFYHDETANDGEYILLEGLKTINEIKFPRKRSWYYNKDGKFLGSDVIE